MKQNRSLCNFDILQDILQVSRCYVSWFHVSLFHPPPPPATWRVSLNFRRGVKRTGAAFGAKQNIFYAASPIRLHKPALMGLM